MRKVIMASSNVPVGRHNGVPDAKFDPEQLKAGILVEMEHSDNRDIAKAIAKDHLAQNPRYYSILLQAGLVDEDLGDFQ